MLKHITRFDTDVEVELGIYQIIEWRRIDISYPTKSGKYLIAHGNGSTKLVYLSANGLFYKILFEKFIPEDIEVYWHSTGKALTDDELFKLCKWRYVWYYYNISYDANDDTLLERNSIAIITPDTFRYWLSLEDICHGPIDDKSISLPLHIVPHQASDIF